MQTTHIAEYVSPGHPDRLADSIVESLVDLSTQRDSQAFCALECAVFDNEVFIDGRIAAGFPNAAISLDDISDTIRSVYHNAGYSSLWEPAPEKLVIHTNICLEPLNDTERHNRTSADDQNIVTGYACASPITNYLPPAHYVALSLGNALCAWRKQHTSLFGPDFKLLVQLYHDAESFCIRQLSISIQHMPQLSSSYQRVLLYNAIVAILMDLEKQGLHGISSLSPTQLYINGYGEFLRGGPLADNGLSGKKLVVDFYGPDIPIGGGAIAGKDHHKIDVCGAFATRHLALTTLRDKQCAAAFVQLGWQPGTSYPSFGTITTYDSLGFPTTQPLSDQDLSHLSIDAILSIIPSIPRVQLLQRGYFNSTNK